MNINFSLENNYKKLYEQERKKNDELKFENQELEDENQELEDENQGLEDDYEKLSNNFNKLTIKHQNLKEKFEKISKLQKDGRSFTCQCNVKINGIQITVCIDSGCDGTSFMTPKNLKKLGLKLQKYEKAKYCMGVGGRSEIIGISSTIIEFENTKFPITFEIGETSEILIGCNFLKRYNAMIDFRNEKLKLTINDKTIVTKLVM
jgi:predicted aspartyl protease